MRVNNFTHKESRVVFWLKHMANRLTKASQPGIRLCALSDDLIGREIAIAGTYEEAGIAAIQWMCDAGIMDDPGRSAFIDIGANVGVYAVNIARHFAEVIAFEPHPLINRVLALNADINQLDHMLAMECALSDIDGAADLSEGASQNLGASSLDRATGGKIRYPVRLRRGDDVIRETSQRRVSLIKIDVEGHEAKVITGLVSILREDAPIVAFEANDDLYNQKSIELLRDLGYSSFLALDWRFSIPWLWLRVLVLTILGARKVLKPVDDLQGKKYSLVFALTPPAAERYAQALRY